MIAIDGSALIAILENEPESDAFASAIGHRNRRLISSVTLHETGLVVYTRRRDQGLADLWRLLDAMDAEVVPFDEAQARLAIEAFTRYGKGIGSKARLNLADCASYALARTMNVPLLFKGADFIATDIGRCV